MQELFAIDRGTRAGTVGGTLFSIFCNLHLEDLVQTIILAAVGAVVSFFVSYGLKVLMQRLKR